MRLAFAEGRPVAQVARELDLRPDLLGRWRNRFRQEATVAPSEVELEVRRLRRDLARVEEERDILKKALAIFSDRPQR